MKKNASVFSLILMTGFLIVTLLVSFNHRSARHAAPEIPLEQDTHDTSLFGDIQCLPPVVYKNLQVFLLTGDAAANDKEYITLNEAMQKKYVKVVEKGTVNELAIINLSDKYVYINSGEIVKGGKQDRTISNDVIVGPSQDTIPIASFCVESGRWTKRGNEDEGKFSVSTKAVSTRKQKLAAKYYKNQSQVWGKVSEQQNKLNANLEKHYDIEDAEVRSGESSSSLQLTLENKILDTVKTEFDNAFAGLLEGKNKVLGFAYVINGELYGIELYNNYKLFRDLWEKHKEAVILEAITEASDQDTIFSVLEPGDIITALKTAEKNKSSKQESVNQYTEIEVKDDSSKVLFSTADKEYGGKWLHTNYLVKMKDDQAEDINLRDNMQRNINEGLNNNENPNINQMQQINELPDNR